jgi:hypothetical protein
MAKLMVNKVTLVPDAPKGHCAHQPDVMPAAQHQRTTTQDRPGPVQEMLGYQARPARPRCPSPLGSR